MMRVTSAVITTLLLALTGAAGAAVQDPTMPYRYDSTVEVSHYRSREAVEWNLTGIRIRGGERTALLNGRLVRVGDVIGPATVIDINPVEIILSYENRRLAVKLLISDIKRPVTGDSPR